MESPYICWYCKHFTVEKGCEHFGKNIPDLITVGRFDHTTPIKNEKILFEMKSSVKERLDKKITIFDNETDIKKLGDFISDKKLAKKIATSIIKSGIDF